MTASSLKTDSSAKICAALTSDVIVEPMNDERSIIIFGKPQLWTHRGEPVPDRWPCEQFQCLVFNKLFRTARNAFRKKMPQTSATTAVALTTMTIHATKDRRAATAGGKYLTSSPSTGEWTSITRSESRKSDRSSSMSSMPTMPHIIA